MVVSRRERAIVRLLVIVDLQLISCQTWRHLMQTRAQGNTDTSDFGDKFSISFLVPAVLNDQ